MVYLPEQQDGPRNVTLDLLFKEHETALRAFLRVRMVNQDDIEDLIQDVYIRLAKVNDLIEKVNRRNGSTRAYLFSIANNLVIDHARRRAVRQKYVNEQQLDNQDSYTGKETPEDYMMAEQELKRIKTVIMGLKPKVRRAFLLSRFRYMSYGQVAEEMDIPVKRVEKYISEALATIKEGVS